MVAGGAVDLDQAPGDIVFLSAADSELTALAAAALARLPSPSRASVPAGVEP